MDRIQLRRDTAARWAEINPVLLEGEVGFETDTRLRKIGDGVSRWNELGYLKAEGIVQETGDSENVVISQKAVTDKLSELDSEVVASKIYTNGQIKVIQGAITKSEGSIQQNYNQYWNTSGWIKISSIFDIDKGISLNRKTSLNKSQEVYPILFKDNEGVVSYIEKVGIQYANDDIPENAIYVAFNFFSAESVFSVVEIQSLSKSVSENSRTIAIQEEEIKGLKDIVVGLKDVNVCKENYAYGGIGLYSNSSTSGKTAVGVITNESGDYIVVVEDSSLVSNCLSFISDDYITAMQSTGGNVHCPHQIIDNTRIKVSIPRGYKNVGVTFNGLVNNAQYYKIGEESLVDAVETLKSQIGSASLRTIDCFGDSLTYNRYPSVLSELSGRVCNNYGYGSRTSQYIRDRFLENYNKENTAIIWVGRNNYDEPECVIDDIRTMVDALGTSNYLILSCPNGSYGNFVEGDENSLWELKGGVKYKFFKYLEDYLSNEYGSHFFNVRRALINGWSQNISLVNSFTQPNVGESVEIEVSDANALTNYNQYDLNRWGESFMKKIVIGINGSYDIYSVVSVVDQHRLVVRLDESNRIAPNKVVQNEPKSRFGLEEYIIKLRVEQYADYMCREYDTTLSTFRSDDIHYGTQSFEFVAKKIMDALNAINL